MTVAKDWDDAFPKIARWIAFGANIPNANVKWVGQGGKLPSTPWISAKLMTTRGFGSDELRFEENPLALEDDDVDGVDADADTLTVGAHAYGVDPYADDDAKIRAVGPIRFTTTGTLPSPFVIATDYWLVILDADTVMIATSRANAVEEVPVVIDIVDGGVGTHTIVGTDDTRRVLEEAKYIAQGHRVAVLSLQCFADDAIGDGRGQAILERIRGSFRLPSQQERLRLIGFAVASIGAATNVGGSTSGAAALEPRAVCEVTLNYVDGAEEPVTTVESADGTFTAENAVGEELVEEPFHVEREA